MKILRGLPVVAQSIDNYNAIHKPSIGRENVGSIAHIGMVSNIVRCIEYNKPPGSILQDSHGQLWSVTSSSMRYSWQCDVILKSCSAEVTVKVSLPHVDWQIVSLHGQPEMPEITYVDQPIPSSLFQFLPKDISIGDLIFEIDSNGQGNPKCVRIHGRTSRWSI